MSEEDKLASEVLMTATEVVIGSACVTTLIANFLFKNGLSKLLTAWNSLQVAIHMVLIDIFTAASGESITLRLLQYLKVELGDLKPILMDFFDIESSEAINVHFEASGYETSNFILNLGPIFAVTLLAPAYVLLMLLLSKLCCCGKVKSYARGKVDDTFFNGIL